MTKLSDDPAVADEAAEILKAVAHPLRLRIIALLCRGEQNVGALAELLGTNQALVSQQLRILRMRKLVSVVRADGFATYRLAKSHLKNMIKCVEGCLGD